jgi:S1-C subfamily serine protease
LLLEGLAQKKKGRGGGLRLTDGFLAELDKATGLEPQAASTGSAFFVSADGHLITNEHVIEIADRVVVAFKGKEYLAQIVAADPETDLALLKIEYRPARWATFRDTVRLGEDVCAFGFPLSSVLTKTGNFTRGSVTGVAGMFDEATQFQIQAPIQGGNSGGPVADADGNVVGVVVAGVKRSHYTIDEMPENTNFAIRAETTLRFARQFGVSIAEATREPKGSDWSTVAHRMKDMTALVYSDEGYGPVPDDLHPKEASVLRLNLGKTSTHSVGKAWAFGSGALAAVAAALVWASGWWPL